MTHLIFDILFYLEAKTRMRYTRTSDPLVKENST